MTSKLTRERLQEIAEDGFLKHGESKELARMALAAMDSEPVAEVYQPQNVGICAALGPSVRMLCPLKPGEKLYRHAQPAPVGNEFIPKNLDRALGVLGMALPESKEEFNLQSERWIQRLIDRVIRYADEFKEQPSPVVPDDLLSMAASAIEDLLEHTDPNTSYYSGVWADVPGKLRAAILQSGNSPVIPDGYVMVPKEPTEEMIAAAMNCDDVEFNSDETFCVNFDNIYAAMVEAAPQEVPDGK
ncbi:hypothetical protein ACI2JR_27125 [Klebsiella sp. NPDC088457]